MPGNFQVSSKMHDGRIFVVAGETYEDFKNNLNSLLGTMDAETLLTTMTTSLIGHSPTQTNPYAVEDAINAKVQAGFPGATIVNPTPANSPSAQAVAGSGRNCLHGPMTRREGQGAKGPWKGYMCPTPKGTPDQCDPVFVKRGTPEWNNF